MSKNRPISYYQCNFSRDIAAQLIDEKINQEIRVLLGGGRKNMLPNDTRDPEDTDLFGQRSDGRNLLEVSRECISKALFVASDHD